MRARTTFATIQDRWNTAVVDLDLAASFAHAGNRTAATARCHEAERVFAELRSIRELERVRAIREDVGAMTESG
jgi:hypothetical protein